MKQLTKRQMRIIIALNLMIVALLCGLLFKYPLGESIDVNTPDVEEHDIYRSARISLNINLDFETNLGGSGEEEIVAAFASPVGAQLHIFGNTTSNDFDFQDKTGSIFLITTDKKAKIESVHTFGDFGDVLRKVIVAEGGYLLAVDSTETKKTHLLHVDFDGTLIKKIQHLNVSDENVADLILMEDCYMLIVHSGVGVSDFYDIKVFFYTFDFIESGTAVLHNASYSQEYVGVLPKGLDKYVMAVNYKSELWNGMSIIEFSKAANTSKKITLENNYVAKGFMPVSGGYVALIIDSENRSSMINLSSSNYTLKEKKYLSVQATEARLFFASGKYYAFVKGEDYSSVFSFDAALSGGEEIAVFRESGNVYQSYMRGDGVMFACGGRKAAVVTLTESQSIIKSFGSEGEEFNSRLVHLENETFMICQSNQKGGDIGGNFGQNDIWLARISA